MSKSPESTLWSFPSLLGGSLLATFLVGAAWNMNRAVAFQSALGLVVLPAIVVGICIGLCVPLLHTTAPGEEFRRLLGRPRVRVRWALTGPVYLLVWFLSGFFALRLFSAFEGRAELGASLLGMSAVGLFALGSLAAKRASYWLHARGWEPGMGQVFGLGVLLPIAIVVALISLGSTSGTGSLWQLFGVFRRDELDLTIVAQFVSLAVAAYLGALLLGRRSRPLGTVLVLSSVLGSLYFVSVAARSDLRALLPAEQSSDVHSLALRLLRRASDRDGDGFSKLFAGGDCKEGDRNVFPGAQDLPSNGVDEDCSGSDAADPSVALAKNAATAQAEAPEVRVPAAANFLLLTVDTLRADLGYTRKGEGRDVTPHLDRLAAHSTIFENAYALASYTSKSLPPMLLGRYASETDRSFEHFDRFGTTVPFIQETLQTSGIKTVSVQGYWYFFFKSYGLERGWDVLDSKAAPRNVVVDGDRTSNGDRVADQSIEQLAALAASKERFFMWSHWVDPHAEYVPHKEFDYGKDARELYDGEVSFVDAQIGRVLAALEQHSLNESTVILVSSDHGEAFSEHGMIRHGFEVWEELVRVPLILHVPGATPRRIVERRSLIDTVATILQTFEMEVPREGPAFVRGESLLVDALQKESVTPEERTVLVDMPQGPHNQERRAFYSGDYKLVTSRGRALGLYNLKVDPGETKDLSYDVAQLAPIQEEMKAYLDTLLQIPPRR